MERNIKIVILKNEIEANIIGSVLKEREIPHVLISYYDSAYDGIFQLQKGWGHIEAPQEYKSQILKVYKDITR
ncbi:MAG: hypothetical protein JSV22_07595 [Bacteroidales bacterium]|nr:MAG: hypothetical protein JSV22_07595 [Bacteroidales bacterium]